MKISIFGLGYVGCVNLACFSKLGHEVVGVDIDSRKVDKLNQNRPSVSETHLEELLLEYKDNYFATSSVKEAVEKSDVSILCINTPNNDDGNLDTSILEKCILEIAAHLKNKESFFPILVKSTVNPGTCENLSNLIETLTGKVANSDFSVTSVPEFLREGSAVEDFFNPPYTLVGSEDTKLKLIIKEMNAGIPGEIIFVESRLAEIMKFINNSYHALKVSFGNEVGLICKSLNIDSHRLMEIFCKDKKLNISPYYFKPGFAYGGSCLPKDLLATKTLGENQNINIPLISSISKSNESLIERLIQFILDSNFKAIGIVGLSFKSGTDDVRNSPIIPVVKAIQNAEKSVLIYEQFIDEQLLGSNNEFLTDNLPGIESLMSETLDDLISNCELIICFTNNSFVEKYSSLFPEKLFLDLTVDRLPNVKLENYTGLTW